MSAPADRRLYRPPTVESLAVATFALFGMAIGSARIGDNSMFVHIRTGMEIAAGRGIPRTDPYSFTAAGHRWVVQSWLPAWTYGWAERLGGFGWVAAEQGVLLAVLAWLVLRLAKTGNVARTIAAGGIAIGIGAPFWSVRPLVFGLIAFALTVLIVEKRAHPGWLVPVVWLWVNSHGSFPLGLAWIAVVTVGAALDGRRWPREELRYAGGFVAGLVIAAINPLGPRLLTFPLTVGDKQSVFKTVVEWQSPDFQRVGGMVALAFLVLALLVLFRQRVTWRDALPVAAFMGLGLFAMRNLAPMAVVMAPVLSRALTPSPTGGFSAPTVSRVNTGIAALMAAVFVVLGAGAAAGAGLDTKAYPVAATTWLEHRGYTKAPHRIAQQDVVGCYFDLRFGRGARVFVDDRVDMFPVEVSNDYFALLRGSPRSLRILDDRRVDAVLWQDGKALVAILNLADNWHRAYNRNGWVIYLRR
ncbi:MAG TPA: hypothetical protein VFB78_04635 [Acidimicrobiales bacterium]|nr:hypothetical protein [Acidimicrobiales bacterium]